MRRQDLIVPYVEADSDKPDTDMAGTMASTLPMAAMFTRNKLIGWAAVIMAIQAFLSETPAQKKNASTPTIFSVFMSLVALGVAYMPLFMPPQIRGRGTETEAPAAVPPA